MEELYENLKKSRDTLINYCNNGGMIDGDTEAELLAQIVTYLDMMDKFIWRKG
jgi:uncharacterized protein YuzB (UPF0349 family)